MKAFASLVTLSVLFTQSLLGVVTLSIVEDLEGNTTMTYTGAWDVYSFGSNLSGDYWSISDNQGLRSMSGYSYGNGGITTPYPWDGLADGAVVAGSNFTGDSFGFSPSYVFAPTGYTAGNSFSGSITFAGTTLADIGLTSGASGVLTGSGNTVNWTASAVPEPSAYALIIGLISFASVQRRRRRA